MTKTHLNILLFVLFSYSVLAISSTKNDISISSNDEYATCNGRVCSYEFFVNNEKISDSQLINLALFSNDFKADILDISSFETNVAHQSVDRHWEFESFDCSYFAYPDDVSGKEHINDSKPIFVNMTCVNPVLKEVVFNKIYDDFVSIPLRVVNDTDALFGNNSDYCVGKVRSIDNLCMNVSDYSGLKQSSSTRLLPLEQKQYKITFKVPLLSTGKFDVNAYGSNVTILDPFVNNHYFTEPFDDRAFIDNSTTNATISDGVVSLQSYSYAYPDYLNDSSINASFITVSQGGSGGPTYDLTENSVYTSVCTFNSGGAGWNHYANTTFLYNISNNETLIFNYTVHLVGAGTNPYESVYFKLENNTNLTNVLVFAGTSGTVDSSARLGLTYYSTNNSVDVYVNDTYSFTILGIAKNPQLRIYQYAGGDNGEITNQITVTDYKIRTGSLYNSALVVQSVNLNPAVSIASFSAKYNDSGVNCSYYYSVDNTSWTEFNNLTTYNFANDVMSFFWKATIDVGCSIYDLNFTFFDGYVNETLGRSAIETGITNALIGNYTIYTDQQVYGRHVNGTQMLGTFDKFVVYSGTNQRWAFNYDLNSSSGFTNMFNITPVFYVLEFYNFTANNITATVQSFINSTKLN